MLCPEDIRQIIVDLEIHKDASDPKVSRALDDLVCYLERGQVRVAHFQENQQIWVVNTWVRQGILWLFRLGKGHVMDGSALSWYDKMPLKTQGWSQKDFQDHGFRAVPGAWMRKGTYIGTRSVIMNSFVNIGAYVGEETLIDSDVLVGSCAQVGRRCHISAGVKLGGVLEPENARPVIIEDDCFIGAGCQILEGRLISKGSVLGAGVTLTESTKVVDRASGLICMGDIPPYSVVIPGSLALSDLPQVSVQCAIITKTVTPETRKRTQINDLLRD